MSLSYPVLSRPALGRTLTRGALYGGAAMLFAVAALGPPAAALGVTAGRSPLGWLAAAGWGVLVLVVVWAFGRAAEQPEPAPEPRPFGRRGLPAQPPTPARRGGPNLVALSAASSVAVLMLAVLVRTWS